MDERPYMTETMKLRGEIKALEQELADTRVALARLTKELEDAKAVIQNLYETTNARRRHDEETDPDTDSAARRLRG